MRTRSIGSALAGFTFVVATGAVGVGCGHLSSESPPGADGGPGGTSTLDSGAPANGLDSGPGTDASPPPPHVPAQQLDLLFTIDNSASMGDKQAYLEQAVPGLIQRLVTPNCVDANGNDLGASTGDGVCPSGGSLEFQPVHDMHIGIVSTSLGPRLGDQTTAGVTGGVCLPTSTVTLSTGTYPSHNDDEAHLLSRAGTAGSPVETTLGDAQPSGFLAWFPSVPANAGVAAPVGAPAITDSTTLVSDFSDLVAGVHQFGCGIESQLESWYRFLVQPDPYASLGLDASQHAQWVGVDATILQQRRDFLRPNSLVAVIVLTDENDSEIDVRSYGGQGYVFMSTAYDPPHGTSACDTNPGSSDCTNCAAGSTDPDCTGPNNPYSSKTDWGYDINLRHVHMKAKYGLDPQFPISRYVNGLTSAMVPDRAGEYPAGANNYVGNNDCVSPLFAAALPDPTTLSAGIATAETPSDTAALCNLTAGSRPPSDVFYAIIGGVPNQLLHYDPTSEANSQLTSSDWVKILGADPENYDYAGIDPHMVESQTPRNGTALDPTNVLAAPTAADGTDPISGREWITNQGPHADLNVDREYACIFALATPRDCSNPDNSYACDCSPPAQDGGLTHAETSPVCDPVTTTLQDYAKAYPTVRELLLAKKLGTQGIAASLCPIDVDDNAAGNDPLFGYRPATDLIVTHFKAALAPN